MWRWVRDENPHATVVLSPLLVRAHYKSATFQMSDGHFCPMELLNTQFKRGFEKKNKPHNKKPSLSCLSKGLDQYTLKAVEQKQNLIHLVSESNSASRHFMGCLLDGTEFKMSLIIYKGAKLIKKRGLFL